MWNGCKNRFKSCHGSRVVSLPVTEILYVHHKLKSLPLFVTVCLCYTVLTKMKKCYRFWLQLKDIVSRDNVGMAQSPDDLHFSRQELFWVTWIYLFYVYNLYSNCFLQSGWACLHNFAINAFSEDALKYVTTALHDPCVHHVYSVQLSYTICSKIGGEMPQSAAFRIMILWHHFREHWEKNMASHFFDFLSLYMFDQFYFFLIMTNFCITFVFKDIHFN